MFRNTPCHIVGEVSLLIRHHLLRSTNTLEGIEVVAAHPQALAQCHAWLSKHLPHAERRPVESNAEGARLAATKPRLGRHQQRARRPAVLACTSSATPSRTMPTTARALPSSACRTPWPHQRPRARTAPA